LTAKYIDQSSIEQSGASKAKSWPSHKEKYDATIASNLAEKLVRELTQNGIQCDEQTQMLLRAQITIAYDPQEKYKQLRKDISSQLGVRHRS